jgi:hypothetical protein
MELVLVPMIILVVMYAARRSLAAGLLAGAVFAGMLAPAGGRAALVAAAGVATSGVLLGLAARGGGWTGGDSAAGGVLIAAIPLAVGQGVTALVWERELLRERLMKLVEGQVGDALPPERRGELAEFLLGLAPASAALIGCAFAFGSYLLARRLFPRLGAPVRPLGQLKHLRFPFALVWSFALGLFLCVLGRGIGVRWLLLAGLNLSLVHGVAFFVEGLAVGRHALEARAVPGPAQLVMGMLALIMPMPLVVGAIGLLDMWFDFRRLLPPPAGEEGRPAEGG